MRHGFREAFENGAIDIAAPDPQKTGGLLETRRIADYADTHYISMAPHCIAVADRDDRQRARRAPRSRTSSRSSGTG